MSRTLRSGAKYSTEEMSRNTRRNKSDMTYRELNEELPEEDVDNNVEDEEEEEEVVDMNEVDTTSHRPYASASRQLEQMKRLESNRRIPPKSKSKPVKSQPKSDRSKSGGFSWLLYTILAIIALIAGYFGFDGQRFFRSDSNERSTDKFIEWQTFNNEFNGFGLKYSEVLPDSGLKVLRIGVRNVMDRKPSIPSTPAVILLIASESNTNILKCIVNDFVNTINKAYNEDNALRIDGKQTSAEDIVQKFDRNFGVNRKHVIVIENMESIDPKDVMSLHQFTDHKNAKYREAILVLTAINYQKFNTTKSTSSKEMDSIATQLFEMKWKNSLHEDQTYALISRLTPSVVAIGDNAVNDIKC